MQQEMISIIIPMYNAEKYIEECLNSIVSQSDDNFEVIIVDDGSTDFGKEKCFHFIKSDSRIKYLYQDNAGVSEARNTGIMQAQGEWICFLDADDYFLEDALKKVRPYLTHKTNVLYCNYCSDGNPDPKFSKEYNIIDSTDVLEASLDYVSNYREMSKYVYMQYSVFTSCWGKFYRKSMLSNLKEHFPVNLKLSEDLIFNINVLENVNQIAILDLPVVFYRTNPNSVTNHYTADHFANRKELFHYLLNRKMHYVNCEKAKEKYILSCVLQLNEKVTESNDRRDCIREYNRIGNDVKIKKILKNDYGCLSDSEKQNVYYKIVKMLLANNIVVLSVAIGVLYKKLKMWKINLG